MTTRADHINDKLINTAHFVQTEGLKEAEAYAVELGAGKSQMKPLVRNIVRHVEVGGYESVVLAAISCLSLLVDEGELAQEFHSFEGVKRLCACITEHKKDTVKQKGLLLLALISKDANSHNALVSQGVFDVITKLLKGTEVNVRLAAYVVARRILAASTGFHRQAVRAQLARVVVDQLKRDEHTGATAFQTRERVCQLDVVKSLALYRDLVQDLRIGDLQQTLWRHVVSDDAAVSLAALKVFKEWLNDDHSREALKKRNVAADVEQVAAGSDKQMIKEICNEIAQALN